MNTSKNLIQKPARLPFEAGFTYYLQSWQRGDSKAYEKLFELVFDEIRAIASRELRRRGNRHTWRTMDLANEIVLRLLKHEDKQWKNREHFLNTAALAMFQVLIDYGRRKQRRVHGQNRVYLEDMEAPPQSAIVGGQLFQHVHLDKIIDIRNAVRKLSMVDQRMAAISLMRLNFGMKSSEIAQHLGIAANTVNNLWPRCRKFLARELRHWDEKNG